MGAGWACALASLLAMGLACAGCAATPLAGPRPPAPAARKAGLDEVLSAYDAYCSTMESLSASGDLGLQDVRTGRAQTLGVRLVATRGGRLYFEMKDGRVAASSRPAPALAATEAGA